MSDILRKVQGLLTKSEHTDNEHERDAFLAKAQELMEKHAISMAQLEAVKPELQRKPIAEHVPAPKQQVGGPAKASLMIALAKANRCQVTYSWNNGRMLEVQGMPDDVAFVSMLYTSLCLQMEQSYDPSKRPDWTHGRTYKTNFIEGYCSRVADRIREQHREREIVAKAEGTDLVLVGAQKRVEEHFGRARYGSRRVQTRYCAAGRHDGQREGSRADLSGGRTRQLGNRRMLEA
jgi:hypothetical protein